VTVNEIIANLMKNAGKRVRVWGPKRSASIPAAAAAKMRLGAFPAILTDRQLVPANHAPEVGDAD